MKFKDLINEAKATMDYETPDGKTPGDMLVAFYNEYGDKEWTPREDRKVRQSVSKEARKLRYWLVRLGMLEEIGGPKGNFKITQQGTAWITSNQSDDEETDTAKGVKDIGNLKAKKFIVPKVGNNSKYLDQLKTILTHMKSFASGSTKTTFMLAGDPGTGKTSFVKTLGTLTGVPLVIIEAPHVTQEHLINIPFLVIDGDKVEQGNLHVDNSATQMKVVQAESNLVTRLKQNRVRPKEKVLRDISKNRVLKEVYPKLQKRLDKVSDSYNSILFLDEFYRTSSTKIRNVLRNILNGKIGNDKIPKGVYIIMATNINDDGVEDIPLNQDFHLMDYDVSSKDDFMNYMFGKFVDEDADEDTEIDTPTGIAIKQDVWNTFMTELTDNDLGFNDEDADIRLSPRRLEQIIISLNALIPPTDEKEAANIIAFIKNNLTNYIERTSNTELLDKFTKIATDLIHQSNPELDLESLKHHVVKDSDWRDQLQTEIKLKIALGENRSYVPVVSGQPGIGKTSEMASMAKDMDMGFIQVDVSNLTPEDITGMPIADMEHGNDNITTSFSEPNLYISIMKEYNAQIDDVRQDGRPYNVLVLFDEMNRASIPVFNSIRKVLLEKEFDNVKLPADIIVTGAINPTDTGAIEFTSHTRDVLDIIPSSGNFTKTMKYIMGIPVLKNISENVGFDLLSATANVMGSLALEFQSDVDADDNNLDDTNVRPFYWADGGAVFYVSPREMTECVANTVNQIEDALDDMDYNIESDYTEANYEKFIDEMINTTAKQFVNTFNMTVLKQDVQDFTQLLGTKIAKNKKYRKFFEGIRTKKSANVLSLQQILNSADGDANFLDKGVVGSYISEFSSTELIQDVANITDEYLYELSPDESIGAMIDLTAALLKSLKKLDASNNYSDQLKKYIRPKIASVLESESVDIFALAENIELMKKITQFNSEV